MRSSPFSNHLSARLHPLAIPLGLAILAAAIPSCRTPAEFREEADEVAYNIIAEKQIEVLGEVEPFTISEPELLLRRRLMLEQDLPYSGPASLGTPYLPRIKHWPEQAGIEIGREIPEQAADVTEAPAPLMLTLLDALQVGARNSRAYQTRKEDVFRTALALDLERDAFRFTFDGSIDNNFTADLGGDDTLVAHQNTNQLQVSRLFKNGTLLVGRIGFDLVKLLTLDETSAFGIFADATVSVPLLRGAGEHIVAEPLTQAERDTVYAIFGFERFKRVFAVEIAQGYLSVLQQLDQVQNTEANYRRLIASTRRARRLAEAGRIPEMDVAEAAQDELRARDRWIAARESYYRQLDQFKITLGLPTDAFIELDPEELSRLAELTRGNLDLENLLDPSSEPTPAADAPITVNEPAFAGGPYEFPEVVAIAVALDNRLDLRTAHGEVFDAQRKVYVAANQFLPDLELVGSANAGGRRGIGSTLLPDAELRPDEGVYTGNILLDLPLERTAERNLYRNTLIALDRATRDVQELEDQVKLQIRNGLRNLRQARESFRIQAQAVALAMERVESTNMLLDAGRAQIRDVLFAQESLVSAQNALTAALVDYRVAELELQRDMGVLQVDPNGIWQEYDPDEAS